MRDETYERTLQFGEVDYNKTGKQVNRIELEIKLEIKKGKPCFTASGAIWNSFYTDIIMGGQCIDDIYNDYRGQLSNRKTYEAIMALWERWHLNDMNAGCVHQRKEGWTDMLIDSSKPKTQDNMRAWKSYEEITEELKTTCKLCEEVKTVVVKMGKFNDGLLGKPCSTCGYKYGTAWLYEPIEVHDLREILQLLEIEGMEQWKIIRSYEGWLVKAIS